MSGLVADTGATTGLDAITQRLTATQYLMLLTSDPTAQSTIASMSEFLTAGYARQPVAWTAPARATVADPMLSSNSALITFGPFTAATLLNATWAALVTVSTGTAGTVSFLWKLDVPAGANINETIQVPIAKLAAAIN